MQDGPNSECQDFFLSVYTVGGTKVSVPVNMDTPIVEVRDTLNEKLNAPWLHEVQIYTGDQELCVGSVADAGLSKESTIQAVLVGSATKAISFMLNRQSEALAFCSLEEDLRLEEDEDLFSQAVAVLGKSTGLTCSQGHSLLDMIARDHVAVLPAETIISISQAYGRCCSNPSIHIPILLKKTQYPEERACFLAAFIAFGEMQLQPDQMPEELVESLIKSFLDEACTGAIHDEAAKQLCSLAGRFGGKSAIPLLHQLQEFYTECYYQHLEETVDEAIAAIHGRHSVPEGTVDDAIAAVQREQESSHCIRGEVQGPQLGHNSVDDLAGTSTTLETERELADALLQSEANALQEEQVHLHEAILRSKAESMLQTGKRKRMEMDLHGPCLLLLEFGRCPKELLEALLASSFAIQLQAQGVTLMPEWAEGRLVLAMDVEASTMSEARGRWHVAVRAVDEDKVYAALHSLGHDVRPRLKPGGRFQVPEEASLFNDASEEHAGSSGSRDAQAVGHDLVNRLPIPVMRTFVHFPEQSPASARKTSSVP